MKKCVACLVLAGCLAVQAHIGSPNVFVEGTAGEYPVRVVIRPPQVVPGRAEITVRVQRGLVQRVSVLPVYWKAGREGAPPPDEAPLVRGETNLYTATLWLMKSGAYSVDVMIEGEQGKGTLVVPVNSIATNTRPMPRGFSYMFSALGIILLLSGVKIASAIFGESHLPPGTLPTKKDRRRGHLAMALTGGALCLMLFGGKKWWDFEDANYRNNALYQPRPVAAQVRFEREQPILSIEVDLSQRRGEWTPLIPDHGKMMHLFLVRGQEPGAFAHLHPVQRNPAKFEVPLPPLPEGLYNVYADVTHEDGFAETLISTVEIPHASLVMQQLWIGNATEVICSAEVSQRLAANLPFPPDPDDSWQMNRTGIMPSRNDAAPRSADAGGGYKIIWEHPQAIVQNLDASLRFKLIAPDNQPALIEPYMGMAGHAVVRRHDGAVFAHIHPMGTISMAAQNFFVEGKPPKLASNVNADSLSARAQIPETHSSHTNLSMTQGEISFPYAFPQAGLYRIWVQIKSQGRILTGVFDTTVSVAK